jgi:hypothetical protein
MRLSANNWRCSEVRQEVHRSGIVDHMHTYSASAQVCRDSVSESRLGRNSYGGGASLKSTGPALSYSLETGQVSSRHPISGKRSTVSLRDSAKLAGWEPMTTNKLCLMALELGVSGDDNGMPGRVVDPWTAAVVVSPDGFVFRWNDNGNQLDISDVRRLAGIRSLLMGNEGEWNEYNVVHGNAVEGPGLGSAPIGQAHIGTGRNPIPSDAGLVLVDSLAGCGAAAAAPIGDSSSRIEGEFAPEVADFVARQFGVDANSVDWREANKTRLISRSFSTSAPFDPVAACSALRLASLSSRAQAAIPNPAAPAAPSREVVDRVRRQLPGTRPGI